MRRLILTGLALIALVPGSADAQFFFKKQAPRVPAQRVPELIQTLRGDADERKRSAAAEELREYDAKAFPEIVPALVEAAIRDTKHGVRSDALSSLARIRPVTPMAGQALEYAGTNDSNWTNRMQAKSALVRYHMAGYHSDPSGPNPKTAPKTAPTSSEPPAAAALKNPRPNALPAIVSVPNNTPAYNANVPAPQFPQARVPNPPAANPVAVTPPLQAPNPAPVSNPYGVPEVQFPPQPAPVATIVPMNPPPLDPPATFTPPIVVATPIVNTPNINTLPAPEPSLQFRSASQVGNGQRAQPAAPDEIPIIDLNPVLKAPVPYNVTPVNPPALPVPLQGTAAPPVINFPAVETGNKLPLPPFPNEVPTNSPALPKF